MLKAVILGCGGIAGNKHIPALLKLNNLIEIVAVSDLNPNLANNLAKRFSIKSVYLDSSEMLANERPDIVHICTPPRTHAKLAIQALESGANVVVEKPFALNINDCDEILNAAFKNKKKLCVIHNQLFNPAFTKARQMLAKGEIGKFSGVHVFLSTPTACITAIKDHWAHSLPGGVLEETGPHGIYLAQAVLKNISDVEIKAKKLLPEYPWSNYEDFRATLVAENGIGSITYFYGSNQWVGEVDFLGTEGILKVDLQAQIVIKYNRSSLSAGGVSSSVMNLAAQTIRQTFLNTVKYFNPCRMDTHQIQIKEFVHSVLNDKPFVISSEEIRKGVFTLQAMVEKLKTK